MRQNKLKRLRHLHGYGAVIRLLPVALIGPERRPLIDRWGSHRHSNPSGWKGGTLGVQNREVSMHTSNPFRERPLLKLHELLKSRNRRLGKCLYHPTPAKVTVVTYS